jgi:uncharacterized membrane protein YhaH (DUF805 family)
MSAGGISIWQLLILVLMFCIFVLPWLMALFSKKAKGTEKAVWFLLSFIFSWLGYILYYYLVIKKNLENA